MKCTFQGKLIVFGGERDDQTILNRLSIFDTNSSEWSSPRLNSSLPVAVTGHTATIVEDKMIVIFGLNTAGLFPRVQEYDIGEILPRFLLISYRWSFKKNHFHFISCRKENVGGY